MVFVDYAISVIMREKEVERILKLKISVKVDFRISYERGYYEQLLCICFFTMC